MNPELPLSFFSSLDLFSLLLCVWTRPSLIVPSKILLKLDCRYGKMMTIELGRPRRHLESYYLHSRHEGQTSEMKGRLEVSPEY